MSGVTGLWLRRWAWWGARYGPEWWLRCSPGPIGEVAAALLRSQRNQARALLEWTSSARARGAERALFRNYAHCLAESLALPRGLRANVALAGETASFAALAVRGAGPALVLTAHTGAWEVAGSSLASQLSTTLRFVVRGEADARVRELHERIRQQRAVATAYVGDSPEAGLRLLDAIRRGEWLAFQIDRAAPSGRSLLTTLFGREFPVPEGPFRIAKLTGAPILPVFNARTGFMRYTVQAYSPRYLPANSDREALTAAAQYAVDCLQDFVHQHPRQWFHFAAIPDASD